MKISKFLTGLFNHLRGLPLKSYNLARNLFWKTSSILIKTNPLYLEVQMLPVNSSDQKHPNQRYKSGDIVYVVYSPKHGIGPDWPAIGTPYEVDCKILEIVSDNPDPRAIRYSLMSGHGAYFETIGAYLVHPKDKPLFGKTATKKLIEDTELAPKDTVFFIAGEYWCNEDYGVFIHNDRMAIINNLFI